MPYYWWGPVVPMLRGQGISRDTVIRLLAHEPYGWRPTILHVSVRRYRCPECAHVWRQDMSQAADPRAKLSRAAVRWALTGLVVHHLTVARISQALAVSWKSRQHRCPGLRPASTDQRPDPVRRRARHRGG